MCGYIIIILLIFAGVVIYWIITKPSTEIFTILNNYHNVSSKNLVEPIHNNQNLKKTKKKKKYQSYKENFNKDDFIDVNGNRVRKVLVPSNYSDTFYASIDDINNYTKIVPQGYNIYINE